MKGIRNVSSIRQYINLIVRKLFEKKQYMNYYHRYRKYAFSETSCRTLEQYEAVITRFTHTIEKGLSYENYKPGFGKRNIERLIKILNDYSLRFDTDACFFQTALCCLKLYIKRNEECSFRDERTENQVEELLGKYGCNNKGGIKTVTPVCSKNLNFAELLKSRHSIRHFSDRSVDIEIVRNAVELAQYTPSACNRQGWRTRIINNKQLMEQVLENQNGNRGFGNEFDKLLLITSDLRYFNSERELFQAYIDGGMYSENIINFLFYYGVGTVPLSASLTQEQEKNIRKLLQLDEAEVLIMFVGIGNYPDTPVVTARSERHKARIIEL